MHNDTDTVARAPEHAPINWVTTILFTALPLAAITVVPWYGFTHGYSLAAWVLALVFAVGLRHRDHRGLPPPVVAPRLQRALVGPHLPDAVRRHGAAEQHPGLGLAAPHASPLRRRLGQGSVQRQARLLVLAHGLDPARLPERRNDFSNARDLERDPIVMFQHRFYIPLTIFMNVAVPLLAGWAVGDVWGVFLLAGILRLVINHHFTWFINSLAHMWGSQPYTDENTARDNPGAGVPHLRRGLSQLSPHLPERLPQRREVVAVRPDQVADRRPVVRGSRQQPEARAGPLDPACRRSPCSSSASNARSRRGAVGRATSTSSA